MPFDGGLIGYFKIGIIYGSIPKEPAMTGVEACVETIRRALAESLS